MYHRQADRQTDLVLVVSLIISSLLFGRQLYRKDTPFKHAIASKPLKCVRVQKTQVGPAGRMDILGLVTIKLKEERTTWVELWCK